MPDDPRINDEDKPEDDDILARLADMTPIDGDRGEVAKFRTTQASKRRESTAPSKARDERRSTGGEDYIDIKTGMQLLGPGDRIIKINGVSQAQNVGKVRVLRTGKGSESGSYRGEDTTLSLSPTMSNSKGLEAIRSGGGHRVGRGYSPGADSVHATILRADGSTEDVQARFVGAPKGPKEGWDESTEQWTEKINSLAAQRGIGMRALEEPGSLPGSDKPTPPEYDDETLAQIPDDYRVQDKENSITWSWDKYHKGNPTKEFPNGKPQPRWVRVGDRQMSRWWKGKPELGAAHTDAPKGVIRVDRLEKGYSDRSSITDPETGEERPALVWRKKTEFMRGLSKEEKCAALSFEDPYTGEQLDGEQAAYRMIDTAEKGFQELGREIMNTMIELFDDSDESESIPGFKKKVMIRRLNSIKALLEPASTAGEVAAFQASGAIPRYLSGGNPQVDKYYALAALVINPDLYAQGNKVVSRRPGHLDVQKEFGSFTKGNEPKPTSTDSGFRVNRGGDVTGSSPVPRPEESKKPVRVAIAEERSRWIQKMFWLTFAESASEATRLARLANSNPLDVIPLLSECKVILHGFIGEEAFLNGLSGTVVDVIGGENGIAVRIDDTPRARENLAEDDRLLRVNSREIIIVDGVERSDDIGKIAGGI